MKLTPRRVAGSVCLALPFVVIFLVMLQEHGHKIIFPFILTFVVSWIIVGSIVLGVYLFFPDE